MPSRKCSCVSPGFASSSLMSRNMPHKSPAQEMGNAAFAVRSPPSAAKTVSSPEETNAFLRRISSSNCLETGLSSKSFFGIPAVAMMRSRSHTAVPMPLAAEMHSAMFLALSFSSPTGEYLRKMMLPSLSMKISSGVQSISLTDYTNFEENQVYAILTDNDIEFTTITEYNDDIPEGYVIKTEPGADTVVDSGTVVIIYVSMGPKTTYATVPNVLGYKLNDAKLMLNSAGIKIGSVTRVDSTQAGSVILNQSLSAGTQVQRGTTIDLVIAMERDSEANSVTLDIPLPSDNRSVQLEAFINGSPAAAETINPYMMSSWTVTLTGEGINTVSIYYDDKLYRAYSVDFTDCTYMLVSDNSSEFGH